MHEKIGDVEEEGRTRPVSASPGPGIPATLPASWARTMACPSAFAQEQAKLAQTWTFLGMSSDVATDGAWFRAFLATRSVFVQRFGTELKGFENRCVHRGMPLRTTDKGIGPIVCGYHHWHYDQRGRAVGIPECRELFGSTPRDLGLQLAPVEIATCGTFVFGRFPGASSTESLEQYLGEAYSCLAAMSNTSIRPRHWVRPLHANWRLYTHITLDDYHSVAVHPKTFGKGGYGKRSSIGYFRFGSHSALHMTSDPDAMTKLVSGSRDDTYRSGHYFILQIFANLIVTHFWSDAQYWHIHVQQCVPLGHDRSLMRNWLYPSPFSADHAWHVRWTRRATDPWRARILQYYIRQIFDEDRAVCEGLQSIASQLGAPLLLGALEERIAWFEETYERALGSEGAART